MSKTTTSKPKVPKVKLVSYTMKAIIPTGMYANIQPEITVEAESIEHAERVVMPHIEALFAKYREGGPLNVVEIQHVRADSAPVPNVVMPTPDSEPIKSSASIAEPTPAIVLSAPFNRAKSAIESCKSLEALQLVSDQITKSVKLIDSEKVELSHIVELVRLSLSTKNTDAPTT